MKTAHADIRNIRAVRTLIADDSPFMLKTLAQILSIEGNFALVGTATDQTLIDRFDLQRSQYEGPTGIVGVLHDTCQQLGLASLSLWAAVPAYASQVPSPKAALPVVTFAGSVTFHLNGDEMRVMHVPRAHTDGDAIVHFVNTNVIHTGDVYFNGMYPFIDTSSGGTIQGVIAACDRVLAIANDETRIIPGHGPLSNKAGLRAYRDMLATVADRIGKLVAEGKTTKEAANLLGVSTKTAESHRTHIMTKLDIHETAGLVRYAIRRGLIQA